MGFPVSFILLLEVHNAAGQQHLVSVIILCTSRILLQMEKELVSLSLLNFVNTPLNKDTIVKVNDQDQFQWISVVQGSHLKD